VSPALNKNKSGIGVLFSGRGKSAPPGPRLPRNSPQSHHDLTITKTTLS
jgi:hypothetical protein